MSREVEVADYLRSDSTLQALCAGGIYPDAMLPESGLTNAKLMTKVWAGGVFNTTVVVRQRAAVPTGDLQGIRSQRTSYSQAIEVWVYARDPTAIQTVLDHVYRLMMGHRLSAAFSATWAGSLPVMQAPELPSGTLVGRNDYRVVSIRVPAAV